MPCSNHIPPMTYSKCISEGTNCVDEIAYRRGLITSTFKREVSRLQNQPTGCDLQHGLIWCDKMPAHLSGVIQSLVEVDYLPGGTFFQRLRVASWHLVHIQTAYLQGIIAGAPQMELIASQIQDSSKGHFNHHMFSV